ncbi:PREDICTED: uncharacterized protein LOC108764537 [Trachymyrmex cornetzi]|uniref:uncharacterized protein LOC108764537 n=1 Tax=Trachymyrmex cornetzi TaxID=471704 RepID=UPI00084F138B|nr:PREDICTED: uncharacterized protein LOC108764537 [Trachymyrmex cornetzi]
MREYEELGHMTNVKETSHDYSTFYMPHHGVLRPASASTKLRMVFDGSLKSDSGLSLNDCQYRSSIATHTLANRPKRGDKDLRIEHINLRHIIGILLSHSFAYATECEQSLPGVARIIRSDFYVDDLLTSFNDIEKAKAVIQKLRDMLLSDCLPLAKWVSNEPSIISNVVGKEDKLSIITLGENNTHKTLGPNWRIDSDHLTFSKNFSKQFKVTNRSILSETSQIYDPLGVLAPCIILAKISLQKLWLAKTEWDESLLSGIQSQWLEYRNQLACLNNIIIPRHSICSNPVRIQIHGFSDASKDAYGGCVYLRSQNATESVHVSLLCAKSRVAPLKTETIPRLELCGALTVARLVSKVSRSMSCKIDQIFLWTDSTIVLNWIQGQPHTQLVFVANRVSQVQQLDLDAQWRHISTDLNPADLLSRGSVAPSKLRNLEIWWQEPKFLQSHESEWPHDE